MTEEQKGSIVATAVWKWLQERKLTQYVPWVLDPTSAQFDPLKQARQTERDELLADLERCIRDAAL